jgi:hypothetical protein
MKLELSGALLCGLTLLQGLSARPAEALPRSLGYSFYVKGQLVGRADITVSETKKEILFESQTRVVQGPDVIALSARTVADRTTYEFKDFSYRGSKGNHAVVCQAQVRGDSVYGFIEMDGQLTDRHLRMPQKRTLLFEDWLMEHEILLALTQARSPHQTGIYGLVFTSSFSPAEITAGYTGEILVEAGSRSMVARKLVVAIRGADPFESHVDPVRGMPVYIRFPQSHTEVFLDEVFGENPVTFYSATENKN